MTVSELIAELLRFPPTAEVVPFTYRSLEGGLIQSVASPASSNLVFLELLADEEAKGSPSVLLNIQTTDVEEGQILQFETK